MTVDDVKARVERIAALIDDPEAAHLEEDDLHIQVLHAIANGKCGEPDAVAAEALKTEELKFPRWCA